MKEERIEEHDTEHGAAWMSDYGDGLFFAYRPIGREYEYFFPKRLEWVNHTKESPGGDRVCAKREELRAALDRSLVDNQWDDH
jgi:hypothetical protein